MGGWDRPGHDATQWKRREGVQACSCWWECGVHILQGTHMRPVDATRVSRAGLDRLLVQTNVRHELGRVAERSAKNDADHDGC